ncbi:MAG: CotH kinase family protein, partial [Oscillospiraceae bacterium]|nr:CotH kinase family protein [Oscillospiraceae bacterium]
MTFSLKQKNSAGKLLLLLGTVLLFSCSAKPKNPFTQSEAETEPAASSEAADTAPQSTPAVTVPADTTEPAAPPADTEPCMPRVSIQTKSTGAGALDFVTKPVAAHVSAAVASWTPGYIIPPAPYYESCTVTLTGTDSQVLLNAADADVKVRGNWTTLYEKKPLRIKFAEKHSMLGLNGGAEMKNWVLLAEYKDSSQLRNKTALEIARGLLGADGYYAADAQLVEVYINGEYWGVYLLTEQQQASKHRIAVSDPKKDETDPMTGYFLEFDGNFTNEDSLHQFYVDYMDNAPLVPYDGSDGSGRTITALPESSYDRKVPVGFTVKSDIRSQEQHDFIANYINNVYRIMYAAAYQDQAYVFDGDYRSISKTTAVTPREAVEKVV